jgi:MYXO-CTERM domain-containing protein
MSQMAPVFVSLIGMAVAGSAHAVDTLTVGSNGGNRAIEAAYAAGDLSGTVSHADASTFNAMSSAELETWDVIVLQWSSDASIDMSWDGKMAAYVSAGGGFYFDGDPNNRDDLASLVTASGGEDCGSPDTVGSVPGLTDGVTADFVNCHVSFDVWDESVLAPFLWQGTDVLGLYGDYGSGRVVLTGPDQDYHAHSGDNQYQLLVNTITWLSECPDADADGYTGCDSDCDDGDSTIHPGAVEVPYDGIDQDCSGADTTDVDADGFDAAEVGGADCDDLASDVFPGASDTWYDGVDSDCAGDSDFDADLDGDDHADHGGTDCNDEAPGIYGGAPEICDWIDSDCNGSLVDEFGDMDGDGYPDCIEDDVDGDGFTGIDDCDDWDRDIYPGAPDAWYDGVDSDCAGDSDYDADNDGDDHADYGGGDCNDEDPDFHSTAAEACDLLDHDCDGSVVDEFSDLDGDLLPDCVDDDADGDSYTAVDEDCDDLDASVHPGAPDALYDGIDSDCSGGSDYDADGDGDDHADHGGGDCDDADSTVYSGASESCDALDSDCDGSLVDDFDDMDGDGTPDCVDDDVDGDGWVSADDCDDEDASIYPGAPDAWYDGIDSDCGGDSDFDADGDGVDVDEDPDDTDPSITGDEEDTGLDDTGLGDTGLEDTGLDDTGLDDFINDTGVDDTGWDTEDDTGDDGITTVDDDEEDGSGSDGLGDTGSSGSKSDCSCSSSRVSPSGLLMVLGLLGLVRRRRA